MTRAAARAEEDSPVTFAPGVEPFALTSPEVTFIQTHQRIVTRAMKPYLGVVDEAYEAGIPINVTPPVASGTGVVGQTLAVTVGTWIQSPTYAFQWLRNGVAIGGATAQTYLLVAADSGKTVSCAVTATVAGKSTTVNSNGIAVA
jgi:hypothetical protein